MKTPVLQPIFTRRDTRGSFFELFNGVAWKSIIVGRMGKNAVMGNHYHKHTNVFFYVLQGSVKIENIHVLTRERERLQLFAFQGVVFEPFISHAITFLEPSMFLMGKSRTYSKIRPDTYDYPVYQKV